MATFMTIRKEGEGVLGRVMQESEVTVKSNEDISGLVTGAGIKNVTIWDTRDAALNHVYDTNRGFAERGCYATIDNDGTVIAERPKRVEVEHIADAPRAERVNVLAVYDKDHFKNAADRPVLTITEDGIRLNEHAMDGLSEKDREATKEVAVAAMNRYGHINNVVRWNAKTRFEDWDDMMERLAGWDLIKEPRADAPNRAFIIEDAKHDGTRQGDGKESGHPVEPSDLDSYRQGISGARREQDAPEGGNKTRDTRKHEER